MPTAIGWVNAFPGFKGEIWEFTRGCIPVSEGCANCWARREAEGRLKRFYPGGFAEVAVVPEKLEQPLSWRTPRVVFPCSRSDIFHPDARRSFILRAFAIMEKCPQHKFLVLTKRAAEMREFMNVHYPPGYGLPPHIWLGVSVENQKRADERLPLLAQVPAKVRFVSLEPLLGPMDLRCWLQQRIILGTRLRRERPVLDWTIVGGESGPGARPMELDWLRGIITQCREAGVPCFVKQDSGPRPGMQGRIPDELWAIKEVPDATRPTES